MSVELEPDRRSADTRGELSFEGRTHGIDSVNGPFFGDKYGLTALVVILRGRRPRLRPSRFTCASFGTS